MATETSETASAWLDDPHVASVLAELRPIYMRLFPDRQIVLRLRQGNSPVWAAPTFHEHAAGVPPRAAEPDTRAVLALKASSGGAGVVTIDIAVPRPPTAEEEAGLDRPWKPEPLLYPFWLISPLAYEQGWYWQEMLGLRLSARRHEWRPLPAPPPVTKAPEQPSSDVRPAILIGFHWLEVGGAEKMAFQTVDWALAAGLRVFVVASVPALQRLSGRLPDHPDVTFLRLDRYLPHDRWPGFIEALIRSENVRLVHIHHCVPLYAALAHLRSATPWVRVIDTTHIVEYADGGYPRISGVWSNFIDLHHVISRDLAAFYASRFGVTEKLRLGRMLDRKPQSTLPAMRMTAGQTHLRIAFVGRLTYQKRPLMLVEILAALSRWAKSHGVTVTATVVGEGAFLPAVERLLRRRGLTDLVTLAPAGSDVPALLRSSDILLLPSHNEGLALVCYEAIEQGCIPISTDVGAQREIVPRDLLVPLEPRAALPSFVRIVERLWSDAAFLAAQKQALHQCYATVAADPTAKEVLLPIYQCIAQGREI